MTKYKVKNGFKVHEFIQKVEVNYVFSKAKDEEFYRLLNIDEFGHLDEETVQGLTKKQRAIILHNDTLEMEVYNIPDEEVASALLGA